MALKLDEENPTLPNQENSDWYNSTMGAVQGDSENDEPADSQSTDSGTTEDDTPSLAEREANTSPSDSENVPREPNEPDVNGFTYSGGVVRVKNMKKRIALATATLGVGAAIAGALIAAPGFILNHISTLIMDKVGDYSARQSSNYRRTKIARFTDNFSIDGRRGGAVITEMERFGYRFERDGNTLRGVTLPGRATSIPNINGALDAEISRFLDDRYKILGVPTRSARWKTKRMEAFWNRYNVSRSSVVVKTNADLEEPDRELNKRLARSIDGDETVDTNNQPRAPADPETDPDADRVNAETDKIGEALDGDSGPYEAVADDIKTNGTPVSQIPEVEATKNIGTGIVDPQYLDEAGSAIGKLGSITKGVLVPTEILDRACIVNNRIRMAEQVARALVSIKLMRAALAYVSADDGIRKGQASSELVGLLLGRILTSDAALGTFANSEGYKWASLGRYNRQKNDGERTNYAVDGKSTGIIGGIRNATDSVPGCELWQNPGYQVAAGAASIILSVVSFGSGSAATAAGGQAIKEGVEFAFKRALRQVVTGLVINLGVEYSFEQIMQLTQLYVQKKLDLPIHGQETGGLLSGIIFSGSGVLHKQKALKGGQIPATSRIFLDAYSKYLAEIKEEKRQKSFFARVFDINDTDSLAYATAVNVAWGTASPNLMLESANKIALGTPSMSGRTLASNLSGRAFAQSSEEVAFETTEIDGQSYAVDPFGNIQTYMPQAVIDIDTKENIEYLSGSSEGGPHINAAEEPVSEAFLKHIEICKESTDTHRAIESTEVDCEAKSSLATRFEAHLAYLDTADMLDGIYFSNEIAPSTTRGGSTTINAPGLNGYAIPCQGQPTPVTRINSGGSPRADWASRQDSGVIGTGSDGTPIKVYIREACVTANAKTVFIASSIHGSENGGQLVTHELLYNAELPPNIRIIAVPEINKFGINYRSSNGFGGRVNANGVNLNRNFDYRWESLLSDDGEGNYKGPAPESEPEAKALADFVRALGRIDLALHYHDNISWVAAVGDTTPLSLAETYASFTPDTPLRGGGTGGRVYQRGSFDAWQNEENGTPALLIEMSSNQSDSIIQGHVRAVQELVRGSL